MAGKADRFAQRFQDKQRKQAKRDGVVELEKQREIKVARPKKPAPQPTPRGSTIYGNHAVYFGNGSSITTTGTWTRANWFSFEKKLEPEGHPSDDVTRQMVERAVLAAIDRCLAADHYPKGIALTQVAYDSLQGSPLVKDTYWAGEKRFLDLPMHIVEMLDPLDVEVGW